MSNLTINTRDQFEFTFSKEAEKQILLILKKYPPERKASAVMPLLDLAQREGRWLVANYCFRGSCAKSWIGIYESS